VCAFDAGEVEIHVHGSPVLVRALLTVLGAGPGETRAACEDRARALVAQAASESGARILLDQAAGAWRRFVAGLADARAPAQLVADVAAGSRAAEFALRAPRVVLAGPENAGKSTLFNVLVGSARAITSPEPGTTRDLVRAHGRLGRYVVEFVDSAGERALASAGASAAIEREGIELARSARARADVVLWLRAPDDYAPPPEQALVVHTQSDRAHDAHETSVSAAREPLAARAVVESLVLAALRLPDDPWTPGAPRAFDAESRATLERLSSQTSDAGIRAEAARSLARDAF
jgi:tRNA modification GTPase